MCVWRVSFVYFSALCFLRSQTIYFWCICLVIHVHGYTDIRLSLKKNDYKKIARVCFAVVEQFYMRMAMNDTGWIWHAVSVAQAKAF